MLATPPGDVATTLLDVLERHVGARLSYEKAPQPLGGGFWARIYAFRIWSPPPELAGDLVLRLMPVARRARREVMFQDTVSRLGFPTPRILLFADVDGGFGEAFSIMELAPGGSLAGGLPIRERVRTFRRVPELLAQTMLRLHALPGEPVVEALAGRGLAREALGTAELLDEIEDVARSVALPGFRTARSWIAQHDRGSSRAVVCHGDLHALNLLFADGAVTAVVDWTNARVADRELDVAYTAQLLEQMPIQAPRWLRPLLDRIGRRSRRQFLALYERGGSVDPERIRWYEAVHLLRLLVRVAEARHPAGATAPLPPSHPWEIASAPSVAALKCITGATIELPPR